MKMPFGINERSLEDWIRGLFSAFIQGGAGAVTSAFAVVIDNPERYNAGNSHVVKVMIYAFSMAGALSAFAFLKNKPLPDATTTVDTTTTKISDGMPLEVTTTKVIISQKENPS